MSSEQPNKASGSPASSSTAPERVITKAPIRRLMKEEGAYLVAEDAINALVELLETSAKAISKEALVVAEKDGRKKITGEDVHAVLKTKKF